MPMMPIDGGEIHYEESGAGYPVLSFAPGSLNPPIQAMSSPARWLPA